MNKKAIVLFSGGLDSTTCLAIARAEGYEVYALSFHYGQKHNSEIEHARQIAEGYEVVEHRVLSLPVNNFEGSSLTDLDAEVPDYDESDEIPSTYVPARNTIFLSYALGWAEIIGCQNIYIGANEVDYSGYPDCRPDYLHAYEEMANLATKTGREGSRLRIHAPLLRLSKADIIQLGLKHGIDYSKTVSCYRADNAGRACGACDSCTYRKKGFATAGVKDPTIYYAA